MFFAPPRIFHASVVRITERRENSTRLGLPVTVTLDPSRFGWKSQSIWFLGKRWSVRALGRHCLERSILH